MQKRSGGPRRGTPRKKAGTRATPEAAVSTGSPATQTYKLDLRSGGSISIVASVNFFTLDEEDRKYMFDLIAKLQGYSATEGTNLRISSAPVDLFAEDAAEN